MDIMFMYMLNGPKVVIKKFYCMALPWHVIAIVHSNQASPICEDRPSSPIWVNKEDAKDVVEKTIDLCV